MRQISIQALRQGLSRIVALAERGESILITRHKRGVTRLDPANPPSVHVGKRFGKSRLVPLLDRKGKEVLNGLRDDRRSSRERA